MKSIKKFEFPIKNFKLKLNYEIVHEQHPPVRLGDFKNKIYETNTIC